MKTTIKFIFAIMIAATMSCSKDPNLTIEPEPVAEPDQSVAAFFSPDENYYQLKMYRYDENAEIPAWTNNIGGNFTLIATTDPSYVGFRNIYVEDSGVNLFHMVHLYNHVIGSPSPNPKTAKINAEEVLQFFPSDDDENNGTVVVKEQQIVITKANDAGTFEIGISGEGTYDMSTGIIDLVVDFDETDIGGAASVSRTYKLSKTALSGLNG